MRRLIRFALPFIAAAAVACANRAMQPPGGLLTDKTPPRVERVTPDSGSLNQRARRVEFQFSKVINDAPSKGQLDQYFLISPWDGEPRVNWHRTRIDVRPRHSFRANTAYTVTLLPGLADVRGNVMTQSVTTVFSTGASFPSLGIVGTIFDWASEKPASGAVVEAISRPDSTIYITVADSMGQFTIGPFGVGHYTLIGFLDRNGNRGVDPGEAWDSTAYVITTTRPVAELLAIVKDTVPPHLTAAAKEDSATIKVTFDRALDPGTQLTTANFRVQRADSTLITIARVIGARAAIVADSVSRADSIRRDSVTRRDTTHRDTTVRRDTSLSARAGLPPSIVPIPLNSPGATQPLRQTPSLAPPLPRPSRRAPETSVLLKLAPPAILEPGVTYRVAATDIHGLMGRGGASNRTFTVPKPPPPSARDSARARTDSARARGDSTRARRDSTRTPPRKPPVLLQ